MLDCANHFFVFAIRYLDTWLSWEEVQFYAHLLEVPTVPEIEIVQAKERSTFEHRIQEIVKCESQFQSIDTYTKEVCTMEGIVSRNSNANLVDDFKQNVFKYVRENHVKTDEHWTRNWKRAPLFYELAKYIVK